MKKTKLDQGKIDDYHYTFWLNDISKENISKLIKHCDLKIDTYFKEFDKKIEKIVKAEVRRIMKK